MKPRNRFEKTVLAQSEKLCPIIREEEEWAFRNCIDHYAFRLPKGRTTCMDCGHSWIMEQDVKTCICPECNAELNVINTRKLKCRQKQYFTDLTTSGEYQVLRMFLLVVIMEKGSKAKYQIFEIGHYWWDSQGKKAIVAIQRIPGYYIDTFKFSSPLAIRADNEAYMHVSHAPIYPAFKISDTLKRNGFDGNFHDIVPTRLIPALLTNSKAETLIKAKQYKMLNHYLNSACNLDRYWSSIKICIRNKYIIPDGSMWCDMIDLLRFFGKDTSNHKYVCPSNLKVQHDRLMRKKEHLEEKAVLAKRLEEAKMHEKEYRKMKGKFFSIVITDGLLHIRVLKSVAEFAEEGTVMHHCVWTNRYYLKEDSLILSATINGKRIETVEVSLKTFKVVQSRGIYNSNTEYHDRIVGLVNSNMTVLRNLAKNTA